MAETDSVLGIRGVIEGFYGPPWTHQQRLQHLDFSSRVGFNTYVYAPKHDPRHRARWRDLYPAAELARITELAQAAEQLGIRFVFALHPALSMRFTDDAEHAALATKAAHLHDAGVRSFALLFDDVPYELADPADTERFGSRQAGAGAAHGYAVTRFRRDFLEPRGIAEPLLICPTDYAGIDDSPYRQQLARAAPEDVLIAWTGPQIVSPTVRRADAERAATSYRRPVVLWDNFPVNDYDPSRLLLGPLTGRDAGLPVAGVLANPMLEAIASRFSLVTVARWASDSIGYEPAGAAADALALVAGDGAVELAPLVRACSSWPPSADRDPELSAAAAAALAGDVPALDLLIARLSELARCCRTARAPEPLLTQLRPWLASAAATAEAGLAGADLLRALADGDADCVANRRAAAGRLLAIAESRYHDVLRPVVHPFVRAALDRATPAGANPTDRPVAVLAGEPAETAGDATTLRFLDSLGFAARRVAGGAAQVPPDARVVVVTPSTPRDELPALADVPLPIVAWSGYVPLGLAARSDTAVLWDALTVVDPEDPLAAGYTGAVGSHRGPGWIITGDVGRHARVIAQSAEGAALFRYAPGDPLADGRPAPATRIGLFLSDAGPAAWLLTTAGRDLVRAAFSVAIGEDAPSAPRT